MINMIDNKIYYSPGDLVTVKQDLPNKPTMMVVEKITKTLNNKDGSFDNIFLGIKCRWFDKEQRMQEAIFSTKDLKHIEND